MPRTVAIDASLPLKVTVDLQSKHATLWRLFTRRDGNDSWTFLKEGSKDGSTTIASMPLGGGLLAEWVFMPDDSQGFKAVLIFEQDGETIGVEAVDGPGNKVILQEEVLFA